MTDESGQGRAKAALPYWRVGQSEGGTAVLARWAKRRRHCCTGALGKAKAALLYWRDGQSDGSAAALARWGSGRWGVVTGLVVSRALATRTCAQVENRDANAREDLGLGGNDARLVEWRPVI